MYTAHECNTFTSTHGQFSDERIGKFGNTENYFRVFSDGLLLYFAGPCDLHSPVCVHWLYDWTHAVCGRHDRQLHGEQGEV